MGKKFTIKELLPFFQKTLFFGNVFTCNCVTITREANLNVIIKQKNKQQMKNGLTSLLTGIVLGGAAALLLAPEKGEDTRKKLKSKAQDLAKELEKQAEKGKEQFEDLKENGGQKMKDWRTAAQEKVENATKNYNGTVNNAV